MARVLISMPDSFLTDIDKFATEENRSRSELIREALRTYFDKQNLKSKFMSNPISASKNADLLNELIG